MSGLNVLLLSSWAVVAGVRSGVHCALNMRFAEHGRWMTRSFSICFAAVRCFGCFPLHFSCRC